MDSQKFGALQNMPNNYSIHAEKHEIMENHPPLKP